MKKAEGSRVITAAHSVKLQCRMHAAAKKMISQYGMGFVVSNMIRDWWDWEERQSFQLKDGTVVPSRRQW